MSTEEIRQKAIECIKLKIEECCERRNCLTCEYNEPNADCMTIYAYERGFVDGVEEGKKQANLDEARIGAEAIDEYVRRLYERCMQSENDCQKCPFADNGCQIVAILYEKYNADVAEALKPVTEKWKKDKRRTVKGGACMNCIAYSAHDRFRNYHGCQNCEYQPEPLQTCGYEDNIVHLICPKWKLRENVRRKEENDEF